MRNEERNYLVAPCGLDCRICELYLCRENDDIKNSLISLGIPGEVLPCDGCRNIGGKCPILPVTCETYTCTGEKEIESCADCIEFPCNRLAPAADRADSLPHNTKLYNLCIIRKGGVEKLVSQSAEIKDNYYRGKLLVGSGPSLDESK